MQIALIYLLTICNFFFFNLRNLWKKDFCYLKTKALHAIRSPSRTWVIGLINFKGTYHKFRNSKFHLSHYWSIWVSSMFHGKRVKQFNQSWEESLGVASKYLTIFSNVCNPPVPHTLGYYSE